MEIQVPDTNDATTAELVNEFIGFITENTVFEEKENKSAARRARKHLATIMKLAKQRRAEITEKINSL